MALRDISEGSRGAIRSWRRRHPEALEETAKLTGQGKPKVALAMGG
jgi:hypothetical protein